MTLQDPKIIWYTKDFHQFGKKVEDTKSPDKIFLSSADDTYSPVLAGDTSKTYGLYVTNNFVKGQASTEDCYDIKSVKLSIRADDGTFNEEMVTGKWIKARCTSISGDKGTFTPVGATLNSSSYQENNIQVGCGDPAIGVDAISGKANDGSEKGTGKNNCTLVEMYAEVPLGAKAGKHQWLARV